MAYDPHKHADVFVTVESEPQMGAPAERDAVQHAKASPFASEYDIEAARITIQPRAEIACLLTLLEEPRWLKGLWSDEVGGWRDVRRNEFFTFQSMRDLIAVRIAELALDAERVNAFPNQRGFFPSISAEQAFWRGSLESRMERFTK